MVAVPDGSPAFRKLTSALLFIQLIRIGRGGSWKQESPDPLTNHFCRPGKLRKQWWLMCVKMPENRAETHCCKILIYNNLGSPSSLSPFAFCLDGLC